MDFSSEVEGEVQGGVEGEVEGGVEGEVEGGVEGGQFFLCFFFFSNFYSCGIEIEPSWIKIPKALKWAHLG